MCLQKEKSDVSKIRQIPNSPWRRILRQQLKPKLTRSVVNGAKVNLNRYWSKFEQISNSKSSFMTFITVSENDISPVLITQSSIEDNAINDNIFNETMEYEF